MKAKLIVGVVVLGGLAVWALAQVDGPGVGLPVQGVVEALDRIYEGLVSDGGQEGFCRSLEVAGDSNEVVLVVPEGQQFVLRKLYAVGGLEYSAWNTQWFLTVDDNLFIDGKINYFGWEERGYRDETCRFVHDFPDKCVVVDSGQTLKAFNEHSWKALQITAIGYFYDVE